MKTPRRPSALQIWLIELSEKARRGAKMTETPLTGSPIYTPAWPSTTTRPFTLSLPPTTRHFFISASTSRTRIGESDSPRRNGGVSKSEARSAKRTERQERDSRRPSGSSGRVSRPKPGPSRRTGLGFRSCFAECGSWSETIGGSYLSLLEL